MDLNFGTWSNAIQQLGKWYETNVHTYQGGTTGHASGSRKQYSCTLLNGNVCDDCSGFTSACLTLAGVFPQGFIPNSTGFADLNGAAAKKLKDAGFQPCRYSIDSIKPGDIIAKSGHVEIYAGKISGSHRSWSWGNIHDGKNGHAGMPAFMSKTSYTVAWRLGGGGSDVITGDGVSAANEGGTLGGIDVSKAVYNVPRLMQDDHKAFLRMAEIRLNLLKEIYESMGVFFGSGTLASARQIEDIVKNEKYSKLIKTWKPKNTAKIRYNNTMDNLDDKNTSLSEGIVKNLLPLGLANDGEPCTFEGGEPIAISSKQAQSNGASLVKIMMEEFGFKNYQAAAFAGVFMAESGLNPGAFCAAEKSGKGVPGQSKATAQKLAATSGYGAGIAQWTFQERKSASVAKLNALTGKNYDWRKIEDIPFDDQVRMVAATLSPKFIDMIKNTSSVNEAVDLILRGYENGGGGSGALASTAAMDKYTWAGGYNGLMKTRVGYAKSFIK